MARFDKILASAETLFYERGFYDVGVNEIGERAGVSGPAIYRHFSGKDEILATLFNRGLDKLLARVGEPLEDPDEELNFLAHAHATFVVQHRRLVAIMMRDEQALEKSYRRQYQRRENPYFDRWIECLGRCFPDRNRPETTTAAFAVLAALNSVGTSPTSGHKNDDLAELMAELALGTAHGLLRRERTTA